jgi:hypothetical protein
MVSKNMSGMPAEIGEILSPIPRFTLISRFHETKAEALLVRLPSIRSIRITSLSAYRNN